MIVPTTDIYMLDANEHPVPPHDKLICGNIHLGVTTTGRFQPGFHTHWHPLLKFPKPRKAASDSDR